MKHLFTLILFLTTLDCYSQSPTYSEDEFTKIVLDSLNKNIPGKKYQQVGILELISSDQKRVFLENMYRVYSENPNSIGTLITFLSSDLNKTDSLKTDFDKTKVVPVIKPIDYIDYLTKYGFGKDDLPFHIKYNEHLIVVFAEDSETKIRYLKYREIQQLHLSQDSLIKYAYNNLKSILPESQMYKLTEKNTFGIMAGAVYENSLILSETMWQKENIQVNGQFVIGIPNRDILIVTGSNDEDEIKQLREKVRDMYLLHSYQISPELFIWNGEKFVKF
jgi:uncharacterized protein YtpQ (UPF0354 family)